MPDQKLSEVQKDLEGLLREQIDFIHASCERFDQGHRHEAKRIALSIRVLVNDSGSSQSLLGQLGLKDRLSFVDTSQAFQITPSFEMPLGLVVAVFDPGSEGYEPFMGAYGTDTRCDFDEWWTRPLVRPVDQRHRERQGRRTEFTRRDFVLGSANAEGGAHVDPSPTQWWRELRDQEFLGALELPEGTPIPGLISATVRQVAWEILATLPSTQH